MSKWKPSYNPHSPKDISMFMTGIGELYVKGKIGVNQATELCIRISRDRIGRELLLNAHKVASYQLPKIVDPKVYNMMKWMQDLFGKLARGGK